MSRKGHELTQLLAGGMGETQSSIDGENLGR